jgi:hypothetical protein
VRIVDHDERPAGRAIDLARAEPLHRGRCRRNPERRLADGELRDDVVSIADAMNDRRAERGSVERDRIARAIDPQLGLHARHRAAL